MNPNRELIRIRGARQHNLKNIDLDLPRNRLVVVTGVSGSGKSSLVFDTLHAEGRRRYLESFAGTARQFLPRFDAPDVDLIEGLGPAIAIEPKALVNNPRSTVGTLTEILDYLRLLFVHSGTVHCPGCGQPVEARTIRQMVQAIRNWPEASRLLILAPQGPVAARDLPDLFERLRRDGFARVRLDRTVFDLDPPPRIPRRPRYQVEVLVDRIVLRDDQQRRLAESLELALKTARGTVRAARLDGDELTFTDRFACTRCRLDLAPPAPELFSFVHPRGACPECGGLGLSPARPDPLGTVSAHPGAPLDPCAACGGSRFSAEARLVRLHGLAIDQVGALALPEFSRWLESIPLQPGLEALIDRPRQAILQRLAILDQLGLGYLSPGRSGPSLSSGEAQRVRLVRQLGTPLSGVLYALDEPSSGLHARDHRRLLGLLQRLRDYGNSVIVVEHDLATLRAADFVVDLGPGAGPHGGQVLFAGSPEDLKAQAATATGQYLAGRKQLQAGSRRTPFSSGAITLEGATGNNLKDLSVTFPLGCITCVTGVSGAGKSTLVMDTLYPALHRAIHRSHRRALPYRELRGIAPITQVAAIDQSPIGRTPKSIPATYVGVFQLIRRLFAGLPEARARGYNARRFSFNAGGGRCEVCKGEGVLSVEMNLLPDVFIRCEACGGLRYRADTLDIRFKGRSISDVLQMSVGEALGLLENFPAIRARLEVLHQVGLGYLQLGQAAPTLSGGEAQRLRLARELGRSPRGHAIYLMDQPTSGLHLADIQLLLDLLRRLTEAGHTIVMIEHQLDLIRAADYVIDLGPGGGPAGGTLVAAGSPAEIAAHPDSATGQALSSGAPG